MDSNNNNNPSYPTHGSVEEAAAMVVAGLDQPPAPAAAANNNNVMIAPAPAAAAPQPAATNNAQQQQQYPTFASDDPAQAALAVTKAAAAVGRMAAEMSGDFVKRKRLCRFPGCTKVIKSQGHCQRHGARAKRCKVEGCDKQAQGTHEGMCKRHWRAANFPDQAAATCRTIPPARNAPAAASLGTQGVEAAAILSQKVPNKEQDPPAPEGVSVYESILPASIAYRPAIITTIPSVAIPPPKPATAVDANTKPAATPGATNLSNYTYAGVMPLVAHLREGAMTKPVGWHRNEERRARGMWPVTSLSTQLEPWERQLALVEILLLSGGTPNANFKDLAHAWGREKGFHNVLATSVCQRQGVVDRKRRSDAGKTLTPEERQNFTAKMKKTKLEKKSQEQMDQEQAEADTAMAAAAIAAAEADAASLPVAEHPYPAAANPAQEQAHPEAGEQQQQQPQIPPGLYQDAH